MDWLTNLFMQHGVAQAIVVLSLTISVGLLLGRIKFWGISLGTAFILFVGILFGQLGLSIDPTINSFFKDFGLAIFVYSIGLEVGPSFFSNLKSKGAKLNVLAAIGASLAALVTVALFYITDIPMQTLVGVMSGAVTNTPGLAAAQQTYQDITGVADQSIAQGYAVAYPLAVVGIIMTIVMTKVVAKINTDELEKRLTAQSDAETSETEGVSVEVTNPELFGKTVVELKNLVPDTGFVVSRVLKKATGETVLVNGQTRFEEGDKLFVILNTTNEEDIISAVGKRDTSDHVTWVEKSQDVISRWVLLSNSKLNGKTLKDLKLREHFDVSVTRVDRAGVKLVAVPYLKLQQGDKLLCVGGEKSVTAAAQSFGDSSKALNKPNLFAIFLGLILGIILGSLPIMIPGLSAPLKLGLAGGPLIVAIIVGRWGAEFGLPTYTTTSANLMIREIGLCAFLACVGLGAGQGFIETLAQGGYAWLGYGLLITLLPLIIVAFIGHKFYRFDYFTLAGMIAGMTTDPPALGYAQTLTSRNKPLIGYATVYPLAMFMRILLAQLLVLLFCA